MGFFIIVLLLILLPLLWPYISRAIRNYMMGRFEDRMRRMMGMPTRAEEKKARRKEREATGASAGRSSRTRGRNHNAGDPSADIRMMRTYAEDVEFTEIREYSEDIEFGEENAGKKNGVKMEEQVSDAEFTVVKENK